MSERNPDELGALWEQSGRKGKYFTGTINGVKVVVFKNERKADGSNAPDWRVLKSRPRERDETVENEVGAIPGDYGDPPF